jgi:hypothetical protein
MKVGLCTTTVHVPHALKLMRKCSADVKFFVATDENTPPEVDEFLSKLDGTYDFAAGTQEWECSEEIGWSTLARRNIAFLEALKWGADVIYSWDNDNLPTGTGHFHWMTLPFRQPFNGIKVKGTNYRFASEWFDPGRLLIPATRHRGFPHNTSQQLHATTVTDAKVGVVAGLVIGDPDIDATTRMELRPDIGQVHLLGQTGAVVDPRTWTIWNSQNTAVVRELIPAWFMMPGVGRHDDIYASLIVQRVARERGLHVHFGPPFTYQQRNEHNLITDLRAEIDGMEDVTKLADLLDSIVLPAKSVIEDTHIIYVTLYHAGFIKEQQFNAAKAWLEDVESVI